MVANPIQKRQRNSMLGGLLIGLIVGLLICAVFYVFLIRPNMNQVGTTANSEGGQALVLKTAVKSGGAITVEDVEVRNVSTKPADAVATVAANQIAKVDLQPGTILSSSVLTTSGEKTTKSLRVQEYNMIALPSELATGDYIDIRLQLPDGGDYIVVSKKCVQNANASTVWLKMNEEETLTMSNAIIEYYIITGSKLYATKYTDPGMQEASTPTYFPSNAVIDLINSQKDVNIGANELAMGRYSEAVKNTRKSINSQKAKYSEDEMENLETRVQEEIQNLKQSREAYFGVLDSTATE